MNGGEIDKEKGREKRTGIRGRGENPRANVCTVNESKGESVRMREREKERQTERERERETERERDRWGRAEGDQKRCRNIKYRH